MRECDLCGTDKVKHAIKHQNEVLLKSNIQMQWHKWQVVEGKLAPQKCRLKGTVRKAMTEFLTQVDDISDHLFRANWHCCVFDYIKSNMKNGYVLQVMDFAMKFNNWYQDEVQSAYWPGTQNHTSCNSELLQVFTKKL